MNDLTCTDFLRMFARTTGARFYHGHAHRGGKRHGPLQPGLHLPLRLAKNRSLLKPAPPLGRGLREPCLRTAKWLPRLRCGQLCSQLCGQRRSRRQRRPPLQPRPRVSPHVRTPLSHPIRECKRGAWDRTCSLPQATCRTNSPIATVDSMTTIRPNSGARLSKNPPAPFRRGTRGDDTPWHLLAEPPCPGCVPPSGHGPFLRVATPNPR